MSPLITMLIHVYSAGKSKVGLCGSDTHLHSLEGMFRNPVVAYVRDMSVFGNPVLGHKRAVYISGGTVTSLRRECNIWKTLSQ
jgi:hypothetical protein